MVDGQDAEDLRPDHDRHRDQRARAGGLDPRPGRGGELDGGIRQEVHRLDGAALERGAAHHALAEGERVLAHELGPEPEAPRVVQAAVVVEPEEAEAVGPEDLAALLGDDVQDLVGVEGRGEQASDLGGGLDPLGPRGGQAQEPDVLQGDRGLGREVPELDEVRLGEGLVRRPAPDQDDAPDARADQQRLGHDGPVEVAVRGDRVGRARVVVDDHPLAPQRRSGRRPPPRPPPPRSSGRRIEGGVGPEARRRLVEEEDRRRVPLQQLGRPPHDEAEERRPGRAAARSRARSRAASPAGGAGSSPPRRGRRSRRRPPRGWRTTAGGPPRGG